jgi:glycosyltransferase involved in cell wall biosynthesis
MRVVFAHDVVLNKSINGVFHETFNYNLWKRYLKVFSEMIILTRSKEIDSTNISDLDFEQKLSNGPNIYIKPVPDLSGPINAIKNYSRAKKILMAEIRKADLLIARLPSEIGSLAIKIAIQQKKPWSVEVVGNAWDALWFHGSIMGKLYAPIMTIKTKRLIRKAAYASYVTNQYLQQHYPTKGKCFSCSDVEIPEIKKNHSQLEKNQLINNRQVKLGLMGSLNTSYKGIDTALECIRIITQKNPSLNIKLEILGGGNPNPWKLLARDKDIEQKVEFLGLIPSGEAVFKWLDSLDFYIQPSLTEGLPRAIIEAMSRGVPVIGSNVGGIPELIGWDLTVSPKDANAIATLVISILDDINFRNQIVENNLLKSAEFIKDNLDEKRTMFLSELKHYANQSIKRKEII